MVEARAARSSSNKQHKNQRNRISAMPCACWVHGMAYMGACGLNAISLGGPNGIRNPCLVAGTFSPAESHGFAGPRFEKSPHDQNTREEISSSPRCVAFNKAICSGEAFGAKANPNPCQKAFGSKSTGTQGMSSDGNAHGRRYPPPLRLGGIGSPNTGHRRPPP